MKVLDSNSWLLKQPNTMLKPKSQVVPSQVLPQWGLTADVVQFSGVPKRKLSQLRFGESESERVERLVGQFETDTGAFIKSFKLVPFQRQAMEYLAKGNSVFVSAPTSSGKTMIARFAISQVVNPKYWDVPEQKPERNQVIYNSPRKALSNEKYLEFCQTYGPENVGLMTGDVTANPEAPIMVMTTEVLRNIQYQEPQRLNRVRSVIFDECHFVNDKERGHVWEEAIMNMPKHIQQVHLSATVGRPEDYVEWINWVGGMEAPRTELVTHDKRPVPTKYMFYDPESGSINPVFQDDDPMKKPSRRFRQVFSEPSADEFDVRDFIHNMKRQYGDELFPAVHVVYSKKRGNQLFYAAARNGSLINGVEQAGIDEDIDTFQAAGRGINDDIIAGFRKGVGLHHAGISYAERAVVESGLDHALMRYTIATDTLGAGINKPIKTIVFRDFNKFDGEKFRRLTPSEFHQFVGRAGRLGKDKEGIVLLVPPQDVGRQEFDPTAPAEENMSWDDWLIQMIRKPPEPIESQFKPSLSLTLHLARHHSPNQAKDVLKRSYAAYPDVKKSRLAASGTKSAEFDRLHNSAMGVANNLGLMTPSGNLTELGYDVATVPDSLVVSMATLFKRPPKELLRLQPEDWATLVSGLVNEEGIQEHPPADSSGALKDVVQQWGEQYKRQKAQVALMGLNGQADLNFTFAPFLRQWMQGPWRQQIIYKVVKRPTEDIPQQQWDARQRQHWLSTWGNVAQNGLYVGHFTRIARRTANVLGNLKEWQTLPHQLKMNLAIAEALIKQTPVTYELKPPVAEVKK